MSEDSGVETWKAETTAFDRVQSIALCLDEPTGAGEIAEAAHVAENTARSHLSRLDGLGLLQTGTRDGATVYYPDPLYTRMRTLRELLDAHDHEGLIELRATLQERIEEWHGRYDAAGPDDLRWRAGQTDSAEETREFKKAASDLELLRYNLSVVSEAVEHYETYTQSPLDEGDENLTDSLPANAHEDLADEAFYERIGDELESAFSAE